jgi:hypothetical protein
MHAVSAPTEAPGLVPNDDWQPRQRFDLRPHGTEARAQRERRQGRKPCPACLAAETAANAYRAALRAGRIPVQPAERSPNRRDN